MKLLTFKIYGYKLSLMTCLCLCGLQLNACWSSPLYQQLFDSASESDDSLLIMATVYASGSSSVASPTLGLDATQTYFSAQSTTITTSEVGGTVYYTTDGSTPGCSSTAYSGSVTIPANSETTIRAITCKEDNSFSQETQALYVTAPVTKGTYNTPTNAYGVATSGDYAYVADWGNAEFQIINVSDRSNPGFAGSANLVGNPRNLQIVNSTAYVTYMGAGYKIFDVSNPASPSLQGGHDPASGQALDLFVEGNNLHLANRGDAYRLYDVSNPAAITETGNSANGSCSEGIVASGNYVYIACGATGLNILDISTPTSPTLAGNLPSTNAYDVYLVGTIAYLADRGGGLRIIDVSNPAAPAQLGQYNTSMDSYGVHVQGNYAYIADGGNGLKVIDISNSSSPLLMASSNTTDAQGVYFDGSYAYIADGADGLRLFRIAP